MDTAKCNRPSFAEAAPSEEAEPLYERFCSELRQLGVSVETGVFGARMQVEIVNDGPVTIVLDVDYPPGELSGQPFYPDRRESRSR